ncbi:MAG: hypothetical protein EOO61_03070 [Hymenobacter sp.]|nr:MAG: hypothetical protein EOO61_03070 [Hymenobacter sp.]
MATEQEINDAYDIILDAEKALVNELADLAKTITDKISDIKSRQSTKGANSAARQYLNRVESTLNSIFTYDLQGVQNGYGIQPQSANPATAATVNSVTTEATPVA